MGYTTQKDWHHLFWKFLRTLRVLIPAQNDHYFSTMMAHQYRTHYTLRTLWPGSGFLFCTSGHHILCFIFYLNYFTYIQCFSISNTGSLWKFFILCAQDSLLGSQDTLLISVSNRNDWFNEWTILTSHYIF